ncbi:hypothetical protein ACHAW6_011767 [Cyclotella cf. meneghiniana]
MKNILILSVLAYTSALSIPGKHSPCVTRCSQLPFKVAVSARRAACIESCASITATVDATVRSDGTSSSVLRDPQCVRSCDAKKKSSRRKRDLCITRCPIFDRRSENRKTSVNSETNGDRSEAYVGAQNDQLHPSLPMLNLSRAFAGAEDELLHPSLPMLSLNTNTINTDARS